MTITLEEAQRLFTFTRLHTSGRKRILSDECDIAYRVLQSVEREYSLVCTKCGRRESWIRARLRDARPYCSACYGACVEDPTHDDGLP